MSIITTPAPAAVSVVSTSLGDPVRLSRALLAEGLSFTTYALMTASRDAVALKGRVTIQGLADASGSSYWAVRNQIRRTPWWNYNGPLRLNDDGRLKLERIERRMGD